MDPVSIDRSSGSSRSALLASNHASHLKGRDIIRQSHERSRSFGLSDTMRPDYGVLSEADLRLKREQNRALSTHALPVIETLYGQIANTHSMVVLTDSEGLILHSLGDDDFLARADRVALRPGALWSEQRQGTNAIGTTIAEGDATMVLGDQHYLRANRFLACSSVPILDPFGELLGVLDVTGDCRGHSRHTMALAKMSAQMIENHLFTSAFPEALRIHFHGRPEFIGTLMEGIVAFRADGRFLSANRSAQFQFGLPLASLRAHTLSSLFNVSCGELFDRVCSGIRSGAGTPVDRTISLCLHSGVNVFASVDLRRSSAVALATDNRDVIDVVARKRVPEPQPQQPKLSGLRYLMTGDAQVAALVERVRKVIGKNIPILIGGETGTGKDVLASAVHRDSPRSDGPFVAVNCASIPDTLIEAELFGYEEGAFTGASKRGACGKILQADGGTLFLDEIGDMPFSLQSRLLRVLQERTVTPLGSTRAVPVDFALICATNRNLRERVTAGEFREDLYYRINGLLVTLPPLRQRTDLAATVEKILRAERPSGEPIRVSPEALAAFTHHPWPGNFRQLANVLRTACAMLDDDEMCIGLDHLPQDFFDDARDAANAQAAAPSSAKDSARLDDLALSAVAAALETHAGNVSAAARMLGVSRNTLYRKMAALDETRRR
ncbi:sigma-54-dependent Fis family transcriptional regulator [Caballeronia sp. 15715]|uniref:sigma-54-dependent Fis family transcriptional regulator n=1 Tax=Caballeronia sp. 15715 TaxID=3391030 RepID=UPI0039E2644C